MGYWRKEGLTFHESEEIKTFFEERAKEREHREAHFRREDEVSVSGYDAMASMDTMPAARSATEENFQRLTENIDSLYDVLDKLQGKIDPVLVESIPGPSAKESQGYPSPTGVSQRLATLCSRTDDLVDRVKYLTARIDL